MTERPQIEPTAVKARVRQLLDLWEPQLLPKLMEGARELDNPMWLMTMKGIGMMLPDDEMREGLHRGVNFLRGLKASSSEDLRAKLDDLIESAPDEQLIRWGGVLAWVLTGQT